MSLINRKKSLLWKLSLFALLFASIVLLSACNSDKKPNEWEDKGLTAHIVFDANGGKFGKYTVQDIYVKPGGNLPSPLDTGTFRIPTQAGYYIVDWYLASYNEEGNLVLTDTVIDFNTYVVPDQEEKIVIAPKWGRTHTIVFSADEDGTADLLSYAAKPGNSYAMPSNQQPSKAGFTFFKEYRYENGEKVTFPITFEDAVNHAPEGTHITRLYPVFIENINDTPWTIVESISDFVKGTNYWLKCDLDLSRSSSLAASLKNGAVIDGGEEGHTIYGLKISKTATRGVQNYGLFDGKNVASIRNVTFKDCSYTVDFPTSYIGGPEYSVGLFNGAVSNDLTLENVRFENCALSISYVMQPRFGTLAVFNDGAKLIIDGSPASQDTEIEGITVSASLKENS